MSDLNIFEKLPEGYKRIMGQEDYERAWNTVTRAFADVFYPIPSMPMSHEEYIELYGELAHYWLKHSIEHGEVIANDDDTAVLIISPADNCCDLPFDEITPKLTGYESSKALQNAVAIMSGACEDEKHLDVSKDGIFLEIFAVHPDIQKQGHGSRIIRELFKECDRCHKELALLTNAPKNVPLYEHLGFKMLFKRENKELDTTYNYMIRRPVFNR